MLAPTNLDTVAILRRLLPHDDLAADTTERGYGSVKLTDRYGSVLLQVNVQPDAQGIAGDLYPCSSRAPAGYLRPSDRAQCTDIAMPAGARLVELTESEPTSIGPLYYRCADYLSTGDERVVISEINSTIDNGEGAPTRQGEILTLTQLAAIAQSPLWAGS
jgi:hypothetical protein